MIDDVREPLNEEQRVILRKSQAELIRLLDALTKLDESKEWHTLKELVFDPSVSKIERQLLNESMLPKIDDSKLYHLQGEWAWAKQFSDTERYVDTLKNQLLDIKNRLKSE